MQVLLSEPTAYIGEIASLITAVCWAGTGLFFSSAGRRIGSKQVNRIRLFLAICFLTAAIFVLGISWNLPASQAALLAASGLVGLALGDATYFEALVILGPRRASLIQTLAPVFAALLQIPLLNESISLVGVIGMGVTLGGVAWVISERRKVGELHGSMAKGVFYAVVGAFCQGAGLVLGKAGLGQAEAGSLLPDIAGLTLREGTERAGQEIHAVYGTWVRMVTAFVLLMGFTAFQKRDGKLRAALRDGRAITLTTLGTIIGPFIGVSLSLYAVSHTNTAVASTIMSTFPVLVIPMVFFIYGERVSIRAIFGALVAIAGVGMLMFRDQISDWF